MTVLRVAAGPSTGGPEKVRPKPRVLSQVEMIHKWTHHAYRMAHDGRGLIAHREDGVDLITGANMEHVTRFKLDLLAHNPRTFIWHPSNEYAAFWAPVGRFKGGKRIAIIRMGAKPGKGGYQIIYTPPKAHTATGMEWSPVGEALFIMERAWEDDLGFTILKRLDLKTGETREVVRRLGVIDFFLTPTSRFEAGQGVSKAPYSILYGAPDGLYITDSEGKVKRRLSELPAVGLTNAEWHPVKQLLTVFFDKSIPAPDGRVFRGLYELDLSGGGDPRITRLHDRADVHTLWYSPKGTYVLWANAVEVFFRPAGALDASGQRSFAHVDSLRRPMAIRGVAFNHDETRMAYCAGGEVHVRDLKANGTYPVASMFTGFTADPKWVGDDVVFTVYEDIAEELARRRANPTFNLECQER